MLILVFFLFCSCWCLDCKTIPKATCEGNHIILDHIEDVEDIEGIKAVVSVTFTQAIDRRQQIESQLQTFLAANGESLKMLRSLAEMKQLSTTKTGTVSVKKRLKEALKEAKNEVEDADRMWNKLTGKSGTVQQLDMVCVRA
jgi:hypothetical protein